MERKFCLSNLIKQLHKMKKREFGLYFMNTKKNVLEVFDKRKTSDDDEYRKAKTKTNKLKL